MPHYRRPKKEIDRKVAELKRTLACTIAQIDVLRGNANVEDFEDDHVRVWAQVADDWMCGIPGEWDATDHNEGNG